ncbi:hypothetical protein PTTG_25975 [Puccinia triticina 1-1 BBBD Race 1]|uniref:Uncharacterized protein n=1 Tax=Puccinia triticina (isolate 1-1 / race 1 (BBBD)) TaxID=630390 RepID=A0A180GXP9_PUCT1|nr:hypothetical protein PTTG_25975 [Puccinia triticina 1-1 BBBD Race 1]
MPSAPDEPSFSGNGNQGDTPDALGPDECWILAVVDGFIPKIQADGNAPAMETGPDGGSSSLPQNQPLPEKSRLEPKFVVENARRAREEAEAEEDQHRAEKRLRGIAGKTALAEHCDKLSRSIQSFIKFFLGNPTQPHDYPASPSPSKIKAQYWAKTPAEIEYFVSQAEKEIRKNIQSPPFTPAVLKGQHKGQAINSQTKADVERSLALAGISRLTFDWDTQLGANLPWNSAVVDTLATKSIEWIRRSMPLTNQEASQAQAIIQRWFNTKCREIRDSKNISGDNYKKLKDEKATKAQYQQWRKKIRENRCKMLDKVMKENILLAHVVENKDCGSDIEDGDQNTLPLSLSPNWRSSDLTYVLHCLDNMVQAQANHHKTIETNQRIYGRSGTRIKTFKGVRGIPRGLPRDCYANAWWQLLSPFEQETVSQVKPMGLPEISQNLKTRCSATGTSSATEPQPRNKNKRRLEDKSSGVGASGAPAEGSTGAAGGRMNVD